MRFLKFTSLLVLSITLVLVASACSQQTEQSGGQSNGKLNDNYQDVILQYLKSKYNEEFGVSTMRKEDGFDGNEIIIAECYPKKFQEIKFEVNYDKEFLNVHDESEVDELLGQVDQNNKSSLIKWEENVEPYLEDTYANVLFQNQYSKMLSEKISLEQDFLVQTKFENTYHNASLKESRADLDSYLKSLDISVYASHYVFVKDDGTPLEDQLLLINKLAKEVSDSRIGTQQIYIYFLSTFTPTEIKDSYFANYEDPSGYYSRLGTVTSNALITIEDGKVTDINI
ncbi:hypothetical protein [Bacillus marasmi]|uniref:hypothetical protein n=1 Tax=Bacillus marasmi TaxID=1926279 RepID=UPI0011C9D125|nr:hypothetical protein [Bacillus marasmi]